VDSIAHALLGVDILQDPEGLRMCVALSEQEIGEKIPMSPAGWTADADESGPLCEIVGRLLWRDAAMWVFVETIQDLYGPGALLESVRSAVRSIVAEPILTRDQRQAVHQLCANLICADVAALFRLSVGRLGHVLLSDPANICAVLNELENLPARADGLHPIVVFVEYLAKEQTPEAAEKLRLWTESRVASRTPLMQALHRIRNGSETPEDARPKYCVVELDVDGVDADRFLVSLMFQEGTAQLEPLRPPDDRTYTGNQVREFIGKALNGPRLAAVKDLTIEFFLPAPLINQPVDQWHVGFGDFSLGIQYPIVVRSLDRIRYMKNSFTKFQSKWATFPAARFHLNDTAIGWIPEELQDDRDRLFVRLSDDAAPVCLLLQVTPVPDRCNALMAALKAGIPALLWCRHATVDIRAGLSALMTQSAPLRELPRRIFEFRRQAVSDGVDRRHLAHHLTLLWDDADRIPGADSPLYMPG
jgi:hypothetical protein